MDDALNGKSETTTINGRIYSCVTDAILWNGIIMSYLGCWSHVQSPWQRFALISRIKDHPAQKNKFKPTERAFSDTSLCWQALGFL